MADEIRYSEPDPQHPDTPESSKTDDGAFLRIEVIDQAEYPLLAILLLKPELIKDIQATKNNPEGLTGRDFFLISNGYLYRAMAALYKKDGAYTVDTLCDWLENRIDDVNGMTWLESVGTGILRGREWLDVHLPYYANQAPPVKEVHTVLADQIKSASIRRKLLSTFGELANLVYRGDGDLQETLTAVNNTVQAITTPALISVRDLTPVPMNTLLGDYFDQFSNDPAEVDPMSLTVGYNYIDNTLGGIPNEEITSICGRPSHGKSSLIAELVVRLAQRGKRGLLVTTEMQPDRYLDRMTANWTLRNVPKDDALSLATLRTRYLQAESGQMTVLAASVDALAGLPVWFMPSTTIRLGDIETAVKAMYNAGIELDWIAVDYIGAIKKPDYRMPKYELISAAYYEINEIVSQYGIAGLVATQLNRNPDKRADHTPNMGDLEQGGEQPSALILATMRPVIYDPDYLEPGDLHVYPLKVRNAAFAPFQIFKSELEYGVIRETNSYSAAEMQKRDEMSRKLTEVKSWSL